ncbi:hypothetical protein ABZ347_27840, partial [Streptomyces sp. NPDC005953]
MTTRITFEAAAHVLFQERLGGWPPSTFAAKLLNLWTSADSANAARLATAFPEYGAAIALVRSGTAGIEQLRQIADGETVREKGTQPAEPADLTIYRASHDSIVMGLYQTPEEARRHCETVLRREYEGATVEHWWPEPEDDEAELFEHVTPKGFDTGRTWRTGYVVTALTVSAKYDEE